MSWRTDFINNMVGNAKMQNNRIKIHLTILIGLCLCMGSCMDKLDKMFSRENLFFSTYNGFADTPAWDLAKATEDGDTSRMREILNANPALLNYKDTAEGMTLLMMTIVNQSTPYTFWDRHILQIPMTLEDNKVQHRSFKFLLDYGADVNIPSSVTGETPLLLAIGKYSHIEYVEELLAHGADVNYEQPRDGRQHVYFDYDSDCMTPLMEAIKHRRLDMVKCLVEHGADVNYSNAYKQTPFSLSMYWRHYEIGMYLIGKGADYRAPIGRKCDVLHCTEDTAQIYLAEFLRYETGPHPLEKTERYKWKMELVKFLKRQGIDYARTPVPESVVEYAKERFPESWQEYLENY